MARRPKDAAAMSPLARRLREMTDAGISFRAMELRAHDAGYEISASRINQIANDISAGPLPDETVHKLAAAMGLPYAEVKDLDARRYKLRSMDALTHLSPVERMRVLFPDLSEAAVEKIAASYEQLRPKRHPSGPTRTRHAG